MSEILLKVGKKGEIYTTKEIRRALGIREGGVVRAKIEEGKLIVEPVPALEDMIRNPVIKSTPEEAERLSEEAQREKGIYG